ncbi:MAG: hypothetical protein LBS06_02635 [Treponema sp.]|jgi:hypothetical protein|nr:hypothetical protein [Treponema sp.]
MKRKILWIALVLGISVIAAAQTPVIAVFPFLGEDADMHIRFTDAVTAEITRGGQYSPVAVPFPADPSVSPALVYAGAIDAGYALTGAASYQSGESQYHLKLWLWNMETGNLVCSDEMVCRDAGDMARILPLLVGWLFSRVPSGETGDSIAGGGAAAVPDGSSPPAPSVVEELPEAPESAGAETAGAETAAGETAAGEPEQSTAATKAPPAPSPPARPRNDNPDYWLYLGLRGGGSWRPYAEGGESFFEGAGLADQAFTWEGAFQASVRLLPFLALQGEAVFTQDRIFSRDVEISSYSMMFPLLVRFIIRKNNVTFSPLGGVYYILPVGDMEFSSSGVSVFSSWNHPLPLGYTLGLSAGIKLGPGDLFFDLRYSGDLSAAEIDNVAGSKLYTRNMVSFTLGYEFGFINRKR